MPVLFRMAKKQKKMAARYWQVERESASGQTVKISARR
jgi:hypothetical protein